MRTWRLILVGCLVFCFCAGLAQAQVVKKGHTTLDDLVAASPRLGVAQAVLPVEEIRSEAAAMQSPGMEAVAADWDRFLTENGSQWRLQIDRRTGRPAVAEGSGLPWVPGEGNQLVKNDLRENLGANGQVTRGTLVRLAKQFIRQYPELFGVEVSDLEVAQGGTGEFGGYLWYVQLNRKVNGIPVERSYVVFRVNHGNLVQFGGEFTGPISVDTLPTVSYETAQQILAGYLGGMDSQDQWIDGGRLTILPMAPQNDSGIYTAQPGQGVEYHLVYTLTFRREGVMGTWEAKIDAHSGEVLAFRDANMYGSVTGGIYQNSNADAEVVRPMPYLNVTNGTVKVTDAGGNYTFATGTATAALTGKYIKVTDSCGTSSLSTSTAPGNLAWGTSTGTDCTTPGVGGAGNTHAARTTYYHLSNWKAKASAWLPSNTWLQAQMGDKVNLSQTCNAYWDGSAVNFFKSGGGCSNTGELPTVFLHEAGHGLDSNDGSPSSTVGSSESYADINAMLMTHASCVGVNFIPGQQCSGYGNACTACTGIRDADYAKHTYSTSPATPAQLSATTGFHCTKSSSYPGPCGYEGHCESYIMSEVGWDLAARDLPAAGIDAATSWMIADRLFFLTRPTAGEAYACPSITTTNGCGTSNWFTTYRVVDDEDGNLANGTPHAAAIYAAFNRHASACTTVVNTNSSTCPTLAQPVLTATGGSGQVALSWAAVTNASKYLVLRNEFSATSGMTIMATVTTTSYTDVAVATGITYYYTIQAVGSNASCASAVAAVKSATPAAGTTYTISGTITLSGAGLAGVTVSTTGASTTTSSTGAYTLSGLANGTYTVTPSLSGYTFSPTSTSTTISGANVTGINFTATQVTVTYSISGTVSGAIAAGVTMNLTGAATATTTTATGGTYTFAGLANGSYTVTPSLSGYTFSPTSTAVTIASANQTGKNFVATAVVTGDTPLTSGVGVSSSVTLQAWKYYTIAVPSGATNLAITLTGLSADIDLYVNNSTTHPTTTTYYGRSYNGGTTSESLSYTTPTVATWCIGVYGYAAGNYTVTATVTTGTATYSISGTVSGAVASGVTMTLSGAGTGTTTTDSSGNYTFTGRANGSYTVTPSLSGYTFSPTSIAVTISGANQTGKNFTSTSTGGQVTLFTNGFDTSTGWGSTVVTTGSTAGAWSLVTAGTYPTCSPHGASYMAKFNSYNATSGAATRYYRTSGFAVSSTYTTVTWTFWMYHDTGYTTSADKIQPQVSTNGSTWTSVGSAINRYDGSTGWKQHTVSITTYKGSTVYLGFLATSAYGNNIYLDDALVVAQ